LEVQKNPASWRVSVSLKTVALLVVFAVLALFAAVNLNSFITPTHLWLLFASIEAPLGLIMLGFTALISLMFLAFIGYMQASFLYETKRFNREIQSCRELADKAEASRIAALKGFLETELARAETRQTDLYSSLQERANKLESDLKETIEQAGNTLAACIGEFEDRLIRK
jgi:uncharacterized integral membrane protein